MRRGLRALLLSALVLLSGCTAVGRMTEAAPQQFVLAPELPVTTAEANGPVRVVAVAQPRARSGYATAHMIYTEAPYRLDHFANNEWADTPARMLEPLIVRALESAPRLTVLGAGSTASYADYYLDTTVLSFHQRFTQEASAGVVALRVQLSDAASGRVVATRILEAEAPAPSRDPAGGVAALNQATATVLGQLAEFVAQVK